MANSNEYKIKVIDKMFKIIDAIEKADQPLGVNEIARKTELNVVTTFRILKTLTDAGWAYQDQDDRYSPGYRLCSSLSMGRFYFLLKDVAYCTMRRLTDQEGEVMNLSVRQNEMGVLLQQSRTSKFMDYVIQVGSTLPLYATACGKVLLSELPAEVQRGLVGVMKFSSYTANTITDPDALLRSLQAVRKDGYAMDVGESLVNMSCIAVPVRAPSGEIIASLSFSGLVGELAEDGVRRYKALLTEAAREISESMFRVYDGGLPRFDGV